MNEVFVKITDNTCLGVMLTSSSTAMEIETKCAFDIDPAAADPWHRQAPANMFCRVNGGPHPSFLFCNENTLNASKNHVTLTSENQIHDWVVISLQLADAITMFRHPAAASPQACVASVLPFALADLAKCH